MGVAIGIGFPVASNMCPSFAERLMHNPEIEFGRPLPRLPALALTTNESAIFNTRHS